MPEAETELKSKLASYKELFDHIRAEMGKIVIGQAEIIDSLIEAVISRGHVLVEGVPGIGKTLIIRTLAKISGCMFSRIQFTPDLLPTDILGITTYEEGKGFYTIKGPIFANFVLADEINRSPPKVQSALLEAMQERQVTIGKETFILPEPFFVMATQNPIEQLGTYKLPEAQIDRFLYKLTLGYPLFEEERQILRTNMTTRDFSSFNLQAVMQPQTILQVQKDVHLVRSESKVENYIVRIVEATRFPKKYGVELGKFIQYGASPRSSISLYTASKAHALMNGKEFVTPGDVKSVAFRVLRHRIILNFEGEAEEIKPDDVITEILQKVPLL
ncbi:MAG: MoxR family ATPase [Nanoarchaeota archaeon]